MASYTFADGGLDGWAPFGSRHADERGAARTGSDGDTNSLLVTNRTAGVHGAEPESAERDQRGGRRDLSGDGVRAAGRSGQQQPDGDGFRLKTADCATSGAYANIATSAALSSTAWTKVQGTFSFSDLPGPPTSLMLYIQSSSATDSFYMSDVVISELAPPPPNPSQQDNTGHHQHV